MSNDPILSNDPINTLRAEALLQRTCLWFSVLRYSNICPDPWTLCRLVSQITNLTKLWEWTLLVPKLPLLVYGEKYRELLSGVQETTMQDFQGILPRVELRTVKELLASYRHYVQSRSKDSYQRFLEGAPWGWRFDAEKELPTIFAKFGTPPDHLTLLKKLQARLEIDNNRRINLSAIPQRHGDRVPLEEQLKTSRINGELYYCRFGSLGIYQPADTK